MTATPPSLEQLRISDPENAPNGGTTNGNRASSPTSTQSPTQPSTPSEPAPVDASVLDSNSASTSTSKSSSSSAKADDLPAKQSPVAAPVPAPAPRTVKSPVNINGNGNGLASGTAVPTRPSPQTSATSPPSLPRPGGSANTRQPLAGRAMGPMGMGMRGAGGQAMQSRLPPSLQAKMDAVAASRQGAPPSGSGTPTMGPNPNATSMGALLRSQALGGGKAGAPGGAGGPSPSGPSGSGPSLPGPASGPLSLAARRAGSRPNLGSMGMPPSAPGGLQRPGTGGIAGRRGPPGGLNLSSMAGGGGEKQGSKFSDFKNIMDPSGKLKFSSKATLTAKGIDFEDGASFQINMDEMEVIGELGKGNYGSVQQVYHRPGGVMMAMKEIRLELDESKLNGIIMELDILHRAVAPEIVEFYGAFTAESCVYYCMELMDAGSLDTLTGGGVPAKPAEQQAQEQQEAAAAAGAAGDGNGNVKVESKGVGEDEGECALRVPEPVLRRITGAIVRGLKFLKDELQIMHRDVKPTNVLINKKGEVKLCDFGVSGQLEKSLAKTNIGCQSYMAPERIKGESQNQLATYTVSSDVWSVGLSIIELAKGCYPYPPETFANVFAQLQAIVYGPAPMLPKGYSDDAIDFVAKCLLKDPNARPTYAQLLEHPFLVADKDAEVDMAGWVAEALERRAQRGVKALAFVEV